MRSKETLEIREYPPIKRTFKLTNQRTLWIKGYSEQRNKKNIIERTFGITFYPVTKRTLRLIERGRWNFKSNMAMIKEPPR